MRAARARVRFCRDQYGRNRVSVVVRGAASVSRLRIRECLKPKGGDRGAALATRSTLEEHARTRLHRVPHGSTASSAGKILLDGVERCCTLLSGAGSRDARRQRCRGVAASRLRGCRGESHWMQTSGRRDLYVHARTRRIAGRTGDVGDGTVPLALETFGRGWDPLRDSGDERRCRRVSRDEHGRARTRWALCDGEDAC